MATGMKWKMSYGTWTGELTFSETFHRNGPWIEHILVELIVGPVFAISVTAGSRQTETSPRPSLPSYLPVVTEYVDGASIR